MELTVQEKRLIVEGNIKDVEHAIYNAVIQKRVFDRVADKASSDAAVKRLEQLEKMKDGYEEILKEIN
jgi:hypothetical protein